MKKKILIFMLSVLVSVPAFADIRIESSRKKNKSRTYWDFGGIRLGYSGLVTGVNDLSLPEEADYLKLQANSINFDISFAAFTLRLTNSVSIGTALDLAVNNFKFQDNKMKLSRDEDGFTAPEYYSSELKKSKLVTTYLNIPLVLRIHLGHKDKFSIYGGVIGGWRIASHTKIKANNEELKGKYKNHGNLNLRNFHAGYLAGLSIKRFGVYAKYYPQSIFNDKGPNVRQVNIGLSFGF